MKNAIVQRILSQLHRYRRHWPAFVLLFVLQFLASTIAFYALLPDHPNGDELILRLQASWCWVVNWTLLTLAALPPVAGVLVELWNGVTESVREQKKVPALSASLGKDKLLASLSPDDITLPDRITKAVGELTAELWAVTIPFQEPVGVISTTTGAISFPRDRPPYQHEEWPEEYRAPRPPQGYCWETWDEYRAYLETVCRYFPEYLTIEKMEQAKEPDVALAEWLRVPEK